MSVNSKQTAVRVKRQQQKRHALGWREITVWVPNEATALQIKQLAADARRHAMEQINAGTILTHEP